MTKTANPPANDRIELNDEHGRLVLEIPVSSKTRLDGRLTVDDEDLEDTAIDNVRASGLVFELGNLEGASCRKSLFKNCSFIGTILDDTNFEGSIFEDVDLYDIQAYEAVFRGSRLKFVSFYGANLTLANFEHSRLDSVRFAADNVGVPTNLSGAKLCGVDLASVQFESATYDSETRFPSNFKPERYKGLTKRN